uniref:Uncharacterized protein n=1 Tax=Opuntia streptacantha TaxID=393608 RepID=A0A7C9CVD8_OPUST
MVGGGRWRSWVAMDGRRWPTKVPKTTTRTTVLENRVWPFWAIVGAPAVVLAVSGGSGGVGGGVESERRALAGRKMVERCWKVEQNQRTVGEGSAGADRGAGL